jgi:hypothetical protein
MSFRRLTAVISCFLLFSVSAHADVIGYQAADGEYIDTSKKYFSDTAGIDTFISAGIDRQVKVTISDGVTSMHEHLTPRVGPSDRFTYQGSSYYGFAHTLPGLPDGNYTIAVEVLSSDGSVVRESQHSITVHTTGPQIAGTIQRVGGRATMEVLTYKGYGEGRGQIQVSGVSSPIGIDAAEVFVIHPDGTRVATEAEYSHDTNTVSFWMDDLTSGEPYDGQVFMPFDQEDYELGFKVFDKAGNSTEVSTPTAVDRTVPEFNMEVYNANTGTWEPLVPPHDVYENPIRFRMVRPVEDMVSLSGSKYGWSSGYSYKDDENTYTELKYSYPFGAGYHTILTKANNSGRFNPSNGMVNVASPDFRHAPIGTSVSFHTKEPWEDRGNPREAGWQNISRFYASTPIFIDKVKVGVQPRNYRQRVVVNAYGTCRVEIGEDSCTIEQDMLIDSGKSYSALSINLYDDENTAIGDRYSYLYRYWDLNAPTITGHDINMTDSSARLFVTDGDRTTGWTITMWDTQYFRMQFKNTVSGAITEVSPTSVVEPVVQEKTATFDFQSVPEGSYEVSFIARDTYTNETVETLPGIIDIDRTPPSVVFDAPSQISSLDEVGIEVTDAGSAVTINSIVLQGGPASENVNLSFRRTDDRYSLEYPVIFPSMEEGESYTVTVVARDEQDNVATEQTTFTYQPRQVDLNELDSFVRLPHIHEHVTRADGMNALYSAPLTLGDGSTVAGTYPIYATMRSDAEVSLMVNGILVNPGDTVDIADAYDFGAQGGRFNLEVYPAPGTEPGVSSLLLGSTAPNAPILVADVITVPMESVTQFNNSNPRQVIDPMNLTVSPAAGASYCSLTVSHETALGADPFRDPICLVEFDAPGMNVRTVDDNGNVHLNGFVRGTGAHEIGYTVSLLGHGGKRYELAQDSVMLDVRSAINALELNVTNDISEVEHFVEEVSTVLQLSSGLGCDLTTDRDEAMAYAIDLVDDTMRPKCLVEWEQIPEGLSLFSDSLGVRGYFENAGAQPLGWRVSLFYEVDQKLTLATQSYDVNVKEPTAPRVTASTLTFEGGLSTQGTSHLLRDSRVGLRRVAVSLDEQVYPQIVTVNNELSCTVPVGSGLCHVNLETAVFGSQDGEPQGAFDINIQVEAGAGRDYFEARGLGDFTHRMEWNYTPPKVDQVVINPSVDGTDVSFNVDGNNVSIPGDRIAIVVDTPFTYLPGSDWHLADPALAISTDSSINYEQLVQVGDSRFFFDHNRQNLVDNNRIQPADVEVVGSSLVYYYDISVLADGAFTFDLDVRDAYDNGQWHHEDTFFLQRTAPQMQLMFNVESGRHVNELFFTEDFGVVANPGWDLNNEVISASYGGVPLDLIPGEDDRTNIRFFAGDVSSLAKGEKHELVVQARDTAGNIGELRHDMTYAPSYFRIASGMRSNEVYRDVQRVTANINQTIRLCNLSSSKELALVLSRVARKGCYLQVLEKPESMDASFEGWGMRVSGAIREDNARHVTAAAVMVNPDGSEVVTEPMTIDFTLLEPEELSLGTFVPMELADGVYGVYPEGRLINRYNIGNVSGELDMTLTLGEEAQYINHPQRMQSLYEIVDVVNDDTLDQRQAFDRYPLNIDATYALAPEIGISHNAEVIVVPSRRTGIHLRLLNQGDIHSTDMMEIEASVGRWNYSEQSNEYDGRTMGSWNVHLGYRNRDGMQTLTEPKRIDENGLAVFEVPAETIYREASSIIAIAEVDSPHPEYQKTMRSTPAFVRLLLGTAIDGELVASQVTGRAPFTVIARYDFTSMEDLMASADMTWEISSDKTNWEALEQFEGRSAIPFLMDKAGDQFIRATARNRNTGETSTTDILHIAAYDKARLRFKGPRVVYPEQETYLQMMDFDTELTTADGLAQWSRDGGETWFDGEPNQAFIVGNDTEVIQGRFRFHTTSDLVEDEGWATSRYYLRPVGPRPLRVQVDAPHLIELGVPFEVNANIMNINGQVDLPTIMEWVLPNGETTTDGSFTYTPVEADLDEGGRLPFELTAWIEGYENDTRNHTMRRLDTWEYKFPEAQVNLRSPIAVAPSRVSASITYLRTFMPGISYEYEWLENPAFEINAPTRQATGIVILEPGVHEIKARLTDSRGESRVLSQFIDVLEPEPIEGDLSLFASNRYDRAPLGLVIRGNTRGGHPQDWMEEFQWYINGELQENPMPRSPMFRAEINEPGEHEIRMVARSKYGQEFETTQTFIAKSNEPPTCEPQVATSGSYRRVNVNCRDSDGFITAYHWWFDGEYMGRGAGYAQLRLEQYPNIHIRFEAVDDAGGVTSDEVSW